jgi:4-hydroxy-tetrahydrodipicolinate synthase
VPITNPFESQCLTVLARFGLNTLYADPEPYLFQRAGALPIADYHRAWFAGDLGRAAAIFRDLEPLRAIYEAWIIGPLRHGMAVNAALKHWSGRMGLAAGPVRTPLHPLSSEQARRLDGALDLAFATISARRT